MTVALVLQIVGLLLVIVGVGVQFGLWFGVITAGALIVGAGELIERQSS